MVSGPSGVGKSSVVDGVLERTGSAFSVSATTRSPRPGEVEGVDYLFVSEEGFDELIADGSLLEWAEYGKNRYGTPRRPVLYRLASGQDVVLDIENRGAHQVKATHPEAVLVFILPPTMEELERRLRLRGDTADTDIEERLSIAADQITDAEARFDHVVVNDDLETAISQVVSILQSPNPTGERLSAPGNTEE